MMKETIRRIPNIVIDEAIPFIRGKAELLGNCRYLPGASISREDVQDADILIIRTRTRANRELLSGSRVRFIATATIGYDHLDTAFLREAGISWTNCPGCNAGSVAQYVVCSLLRLERAGKICLKESTVGIVGVGHVGKQVVEKVKPLVGRLLLNDPPREVQGEMGFVRLETIRREADVITFHTPLTTAGPYPTFHLAGTDFFDSGLARRPIIINSSRGEVVETATLCRALDSGTVRAAVIDTWENEPHISLSLLQKTFIATPHIAGYSADGKANGTRMALEAVARFLQKEGLLDAISLQKKKEAGLFDILPPSLPEDYAYHPHEKPFCEEIRLYDPFFDTQNLKQNHQNFEQLRSHYPLRREK